MNTQEWLRSLTEQQSRHKPSFEPTVHIDTREQSPEGLHGDDTTNHTLVIAEQQTTEGRELSNINRPILIYIDADTYRGHTTQVRILQDQLKAALGRMIHRRAHDCQFDFG